MQTSQQRDGGRGNGPQMNWDATPATPTAVGGADDYTVAVLEQLSVDSKAAGVVMNDRLVNSTPKDR